MGRLFQIYGKLKNVPNNQPDDECCLVMVNDDDDWYHLVMTNSLLLKMAEHASWFTYETDGGSFNSYVT